MTAVEEFAFWTGLGELRLQVMPSPTVLLPKEKELARQVGFIVRVGLEWREPRTVQLAQELMLARFQRPVPLAEEGFLRDEERSLAEVGAILSEDLLDGRIRVRLAPVDPLRELEQGPPSKLDPLPPRKAEDNSTFFEVRLVDEVGRAISSIGVELDTNDGEIHDLTTNAAGVALLDPASASSATARVTDVSQLDETLAARWTKPRPGNPPRESNSTELVFEGAEVGPVAIKAAVPNTVILKPPRGRLHAQLLDKTGRVRHALRDYVISGPEEFSGKTDENGFLRHDAVFPGDYSLKLRLEFFEGQDEQSDEYESPLVVIPVEQAGNQMRALGAVPYSVLAKLNFFFNTGKAFLLPTALPGFRKLRDVYAENSPSKLLVVGHADTAAGPSVNDPLSLDRARSIIAFLKDDVESWLAFYDKKPGDRQRWGRAEDRMMLLSVPDFGSKPKSEDGIAWFQRTRGLQVDGKAGPDTRRALITEYMALDGTSLSDEGIDIEATAHGCGENFPDHDAAGAAQTQKDDVSSARDRRVELFFFDPEFGIAPKPPGDNSPPGGIQYLRWRESVIQTVVLAPVDQDVLQTTFVELADAHFRTNSAVVLPEGETPTKDEATGAAITSIGVFATTLRLNQEQPGRKVFVAGHADTTGQVDFNQKLSTERARCALALLLGDRSAFQELCDARHTVSDYKHILAWASRALPDFDCSPGSIDDNQKTGKLPLQRFQAAYNRSKESLGVDSGTPALEVDGDIGPFTWGAIFDCYEFALRKELGEDAPGLSALREKVVFVDDDRKALGFSEYFPIEELGVDNYRSQANRRVELLFFEGGEEPDLVHAEEDPEMSEVYLPGVYTRTPVNIRATAKISGNLEVTTFAAPDEEIVLEVRDGSNEVAAAFSRDVGQTIGNAVHFALDPDTLPSPAMFVVRRGDVLEEHGPPFDPAAVRDALDTGQLASAAETVRGGPSQDGRVAGPGATSSGRGAPTPAATDLRLVVRFANPKHRFLQLATVTMSGAVAVPDSVQGSHVFDVLPGATRLDLTVRIPPQDPRAKADVLLVQQAFDVFQNGASRSIIEREPRNPRLRGIAFSNGKVGTLAITLDLRFLDITEHVRNVASTFRLFEKTARAGCRTVIMEDTTPTGEPDPAAAFSWAITLPPAALNRQDFRSNLFLYFQHELNHHQIGPQFFDVDPASPRYVNSDDIDYDRLIRYLPEPPPLDDLRQRGSFRPSYVFRTHLDPDGQAQPSSQFPPDENLNNFPPFNWAQQLVASKKAVVLGMPFPKSTSFGELNRPLSSHSELLRSLARALQAEKHIARDRTIPAFFDRVAIGGWSSGTRTVADWCAGLDKAGTLKNLVSEVYFFDGFDDTKAALIPGGPVELWFRAKAGRKLRLICTAYTEKEGIDLARRLGTTEALDLVLEGGLSPSATDVRALPGRNDYFFTNALYQSSFLLPSPTIVPSFHRRGEVTQGTPDVTDESNVFLEAESFLQGTPTASITLSFDDGGVIRRSVQRNCSVIEAAALFHYHVLPFSPSGSFIRTKVDFERLMRDLSTSQDRSEPIRIFKLRHPWAVFGGALRNGTFVGYLQFCLEESGFQ